MTDPSSAVPVASLIADVAPYILALAGVIIPSLAGVAVAELKKITGIQVRQDAVDKLDGMIESAIGAEVAKASDNLATTTIQVGSPVVAAIAAKIIAAAPELLAKAGVDPSSVADKVHGEIGAWQRDMTRVSPGPAAAVQPAQKAA